MEREHGRAGLVIVLLRGLVVTLVAAVALAALAASRSAPAVGPQQSYGPAASVTTHFSMPGMLISMPATADLGCVSSVAFAPSGTRFAVMGLAATCNQPSGLADSHRLVVYDATYGEVQTEFGLDEVLRAQLSDAERQRIGAMRFAGLGWNPTGTRFAAAFVAFDRHTDVRLDDVVCSGLLIVDLGGERAEVIRGDAGLFDSGAEGYTGLPGWNLRDGAPTAPFIPDPGLVYAWQHADHPQPIMALGPDPLKSLPVTAGPRYPVGNPNGDATFTIWQPGILFGPAVAPVPAGSGQGALVTHFTSWTPDGQWLAYMVAGIALPPPPRTDRPAMRPASAPSVVAPPRLNLALPRDLALAAVQREIGLGGWAAVAWNPSGTLLASVACNEDTSPQLALRDTGTGAVLDSVQLSIDAGTSVCQPAHQREALGAYATPNLAVAWSPDGARLLLADQSSGIVRVWGVTG